MKLKSIIFLFLFLPALLHAQDRGLNDRLTNDLSRLRAMDAVVDSFMNVWSLRGVSLSIMRNDSLVYARGYGRADGARPMTPGTLLRMASVSKLLTAVGIMKLQERGKLVLDTPVFGPFGVLTEYDKYITDDNYYLITVEHLLRHQAGFTQQGGDPMFNTARMMREIGTSKAPTAEQLTRNLVRRPLAYLPGTTQEYSNFGYLLLSMVIEKLTGEPYEAWMQREVLAPAGCTDFHIGRNYYEDRFPGETRYFMHKEARPTNAFDGRGQVERCYGANDIHGLSGAGAWIGSTVELARFVASIDGIPAFPDQLSEFSVYQMTQRLSDDIYSLGWVDCTDYGEWTRTGSFSGTSALVKKFSDGECWILISNTSTWMGSRFSRETSALCRNLRRRFSARLPKRDLFLEN